MREAEIKQQYALDAKCEGLEQFWTEFDAFLSSFEVFTNQNYSMHLYWCCFFCPTATAWLDNKEIETEKRECDSSIGNSHRV